MKFRLSITDLLMLTALVAAIAGAFQSETFLGVQLLALLIIQIGGVIGAKFLRRRPVTGGMLGGVLGLLLVTTGGLLAVVILRFAPLVEMMDGPPNLASAYLLIFIDICMLGPVMAGVSGPLAIRTLEYRSDKTRLSDLDRRRMIIGWSLLALVILLMILESADRVAMQSSRNWRPVRMISTLAFIAHGFLWLANSPTQNNNTEASQPNG